MSKKSRVREIQFLPINVDEGSVRHLSALKPSPDTFRLVSWNTLADQYTHYHETERPNVDREVFTQYRRHKLLGRTFQHFVDIDVDFICLQEVDFKIARETLVDTNAYTRLLTPTGHGRRGDTRVDACCIFYKSIDWRIVGIAEIVNLDDLTSKGQAFRRGNFGIIASFQHKSIPNKTLVICNTHLYWNPEYEYVKLHQAHYLCTKARSTLNRLAEQGTETHLIFCGDLNSKPGGLVHTYMTKGEAFIEDCPSFGQTRFRCPVRDLSMKSIHAKRDDKGSLTTEEYIQYTNATADFCGVIDYIFHPTSLLLTKVLSFPTIKSNVYGRKEPILPTKGWGSDHLAIGAEFSFSSEQTHQSSVTK